MESLCFDKTREAPQNMGMTLYVLAQGSVRGLCWVSPIIRNPGRQMARGAREIGTATTRACAGGLPMNHERVPTSSWLHAHGSSKASTAWRDGGWKWVAIASKKMALHRRRSPCTGAWVVTRNTSPASARAGGAAQYPIKAFPKLARPRVTTLPRTPRSSGAVLLCPLMSSQGCRALK